MKRYQQETELLARVEQALANDRPFGDFRYINERTWLHYGCRLQMLAEYLPVADKAWDAFRKATKQSRYRVLGDPVVRSAINTSLAHFKLGGPEVPLNEIKTVLSITARHLSENSRIAPLSAGSRKATRLGGASHHAWVWCDDRDEDIPARSFRRIFTQYLTDSSGLTLSTPDEDGKRALLEGTRLLSELVPKLARSALNHAHVLVIVKSPLGITSVTNPNIPGTAFLSSVVLRNPWRVAEYLLHESLHLKFIDLEHTHSMLRRGYLTQYSPKICALWNRSKSDNVNEWPVNRVLTVMHTYTCLALFFKIVKCHASELEKRYGDLRDLDPSLSARRALDRAHYLGCRIKEVAEELGIAGRRFVDWLIELLLVLDPDLPSTQSSTHLLLDLYDRETEEIKKRITRANPVELSTKNKRFSSKSKVTSMRQIVLDLVHHETLSTHRLLSAMNGVTSPLSNSETATQGTLGAFDNHTSAGLAAMFCSARSLISETLQTVSANARHQRSQLHQVAEVEQHVQEMLRDSDARIRVLLNS